MIIIVDDTFVTRANTDWLNKEIYQGKCLILSIIKTTELASLVKMLPSCKLFCNHRSLQLYNRKEIALDNEDNIKYRESLINKTLKLSIPRIEFSGGLETNYESKQIDKELFYSNLIFFLDNYIKTGEIDDKILFLGSNPEEQEKLSVIQNMMMKIRIINISGFEKDEIIKKGILLLYPSSPINEVTERWKNANFTKDQIIQEINEQIL